MRELLAREKVPSVISGLPVVIAIDVHWGEMDAFAHLNNVSYFRYFESGRIAYFEQMTRVTAREGDPVEHAAGAPAGVGPILAKTSCRYRAPVFYPDTLYLGVGVSDVGRDRYTMRYELYSTKLAAVAASGEGLIVAFDYGAGKKAPSLPARWREAIAKLEASASAG